LFKYLSIHVSFAHACRLLEVKSIHRRFCRMPTEKVGKNAAKPSSAGGKANGKSARDDSTISFIFSSQPTSLSIVIDFRDITLQYAFCYASSLANCLNTSSSKRYHDLLRIFMLLTNSHYNEYTSCDQPHNH